MTITSGDLVFPLPSPDFLFVHQYQIKKYSQASQTADDDGLRIDDPDNPPQLCPAVGYFTAPNPNKINPVMESVDAVLLTPLSTNISAKDQIIIPQQMRALLPQLVGMYQISNLKNNLSHYRVLLYRIDDPDGADS